jgi:hypothetical protein
MWPASAGRKIDIIPGVFPIGYSNGLLAHDPNLAEGVPVEAAPFVVRGREAVLAADGSGRLRNGNLEETQGDRFLGFTFQDDPGKATFADGRVVHGGKVSCRMEMGRGESGNYRLVQRVAVRPHAYYRFSCWVKTENLEPTQGFQLLALATSKEQALTFMEEQLPSTRDWTRLDVVFNSLNEHEAGLYAGQWGGRSGKLWLDDLALEELALVNVLRRPPGSRIKPGERLRVSWYHPMLTVGGQVMCSLTEPKVYELLRDQARRVNELLHPKAFMMSHDEIRVANWCRSCQDAHAQPGELLARNVERCREILHQINPKARVLVWSDMFDPHHNAVDHYYLVNGSLRGSWKGLTPEVTIMNWNSGKAAESLKWFADRGHAQIIAGYYDDGMENLQHWNAAAKDVPRVTGFM